MAYFGLNAFVQLISHTFFIGMTFWALQSLRTESWFQKYQISKARIVYFFLAIAIGYNVSRFFLEFIMASYNLMYLF